MLRPPKPVPALLIASCADPDDRDDDDRDDGEGDRTDAASLSAATTPADDAHGHEPAIDTQLDATHLHALCEGLARWCATRKLYGAPRGPASLLGQLAKRTRPIVAGGPDADCSQAYACLYIALCAQPADSLDRIVFELHYLRRIPNIKAAAAELGITRTHWYRLLGAFRARIYTASRELIAINAGQLEAMQSRRNDQG